MFDDSWLEAFSYNPITGEILRKVKTGNYPAGSKCTGKFLNGYLKVTYKGKQRLQHRLAWFLYYKEQPPEQIDHINQDKTDNRIENLRTVTTSQNQMNIGVHERSQTGIKGIMPVRGGALYRAEVCVDGRRYQKHSKDIELLKSWVHQKRVELHKEHTHH